MTENKLYRIINKLSGVEKRTCSKFLNSPYFNQRNDVIRLWEALIAKSSRKFKALPPQSAWEMILPDAQYSEANWRHLQSQLLILIEQFLAQRAYEKTPLTADLKLAKIYREKDQQDALPHVFRRAEQRLEKLPRDNEYFHLHYQLELEKYTAVESEQRIGTNNLGIIDQSLDIYCIASKLRISCLLESHRVVSNVAYDNTFLPYILDYVQTSKLKDHPLIALYYYCLQSLTGGTESDFRAFRSSLEIQKQSIPLKEQRTFLLLAINYCIKQLNSGLLRYLREALDLYQTGLETKALIVDGHISRLASKNNVALALKLEEFKFAKSFIDNYSQYLKANLRETHRNYNLAKLHMAQNEFKKAMPMLAQIDDSDLLLNLDSRVMLLKMYFDAKEIDALEALFTSFRILLLRKKKSIGYHQQHYLNMIRYIKKMIRLNQYDKEKVEILRQEVINNPSVIEKEWLLKRIGDRA